MGINSILNINVTGFVYQDSGACGSSCWSRALLWEALYKQRAKKKNTQKAKTHNKPLAVCIDIIAGVTTLIILSDFCQNKRQADTEAPCQGSIISHSTGHELIRQNIWLLLVQPEL